VQLVAQQHTGGSRSNPAATTNVMGDAHSPAEEEHNDAESQHHALQLQRGAMLMAQQRAECCCCSTAAGNNARTRCGGVSGRPQRKHTAQTAA